MNDRERHLETLLYGRPDRIPFSPGVPRESTLKAWHTQGLAAADDWFDALRGEIGLVIGSTVPSLAPEVDFKMIPAYEEKVLEHRDGHYVVQDWMGNITEISDQYDVTYIRKAKDFVTRKWHRFPVQSRDDFEGMKLRYNPAEPGRFPADFADRCVALRNRDYFVEINLPGPFWQMREWCGLEPLCMLFIDDPDFVRSMIRFWAGFVSRTLEPIFEAGACDCLHISEDMAYKEKSMISPRMAREFLLPTWRKWSQQARDAGVPLVDMDSDGKVDELIPIWIEAGVQVCDPMEVAAGNDLVAASGAFGSRMAYRGGVDKRAIAKGGVVLAAELERLAPVIHRGGYIPGCDHGVPPDISWPDFIGYSRLLARLTGWL